MKLGARLKNTAYLLFMASMFIIFEACGPRFEPEESCQFVVNSLGQRVSWNSDLPVKLFIHDSVPQEFYGAVEAAMKRWDEALGSRPLFELGGVISHGDGPVQDGASVIYFVDDWDSEKVGEQARTTVFWKGTQIQEADVQVNARDFRFSAEEIGVAGKVDFESLMVHEFGHVLGLSHSDENNSVMVTRLAAGKLRRVPGKTDLDSMRCEY